MKIDANKLEKAIDNMSSVCEKGRAEIKQIMTEGFGVEFPDEGLRVQMGDRMFYQGGEYIVACGGGRKYVLINLRTGSRYTDASTASVDKGRFHLHDITGHLTTKADWKKM